MNGPVFAVAAWLILGMEHGLRGLLRLQFGQVTLAPSLTLVLGTWVALQAPPLYALWACLILGLVLDLTTPLPVQGGGLLTVAGPHALGFFLAAQFVLASRWLMLRRSPVALALATFAAGLLLTVVVAALMTARRLYDPLSWNTIPALLGGLGSAAYSALAAFPLALILHPFSSAFGFSAPRGGIRRSH